MLSKEESDVIVHEIKIYEARINSWNKAIGRYKGWMLVSSKVEKLVMKEGYLTVKGYFCSKGYKMNRWESLSYDDDDKGEYGIKKN